MSIDARPTLSPARRAGSHASDSTKVGSARDITGDKSFSKALQAEKPPFDPYDPNILKPKTIFENRIFPSLPSSIGQGLSSIHTA